MLPDSGDKVLNTHLVDNLHFIFGTLIRTSGVGIA